MQIPGFQAAYREARRAAFGQSIARLQQASSAAVSTLFKIKVDPNAPASVRVRAADSMLDHSRQAIEIEDFEVRVAALERTARTTEIGSQIMMRQFFDASSDWRIRYLPRNRRSGVSWRS